MSFYSNILSYKRSDEGAGKTPGKSSASMKLLQDHLLAKQRSKQNLTPKEAPQRNKDGIKSQQVVSESSLHKPSFEDDWDPDEEYDPRVPNSYELLQAQHLKAKELQIQNRSASGRLAVPNMLEMLDRLESEEAYEQPEETKKTKGTAIAPPPSLVDTSAKVDESPTFGVPVKARTLAGGEKQDRGSVAAKIMSKMGYKVGQGLGKDEQGMSSPLEIGTSSTNLGRILPAPQVIDPTTPSVVEKTEAKPSPAPQTESHEASSNKPTRVLLLQNMVGPGEVDDDLEAETKEECKKYGSVIKCLIFEIPNKRVPDHEAVRIFVEFYQVESALKAMTDLNGRYFGGRIVKASFYDVDKFNKFELGPS